VVILTRVGWFYKQTDVRQATSVYTKCFRFASGGGTCDNQADIFINSSFMKGYPHVWVS